jgi:hypothetical protein
MRLRYYGFLANRHRAEKLQRAKRLLSKTDSTIGNDLSHNGEDLPTVGDSAEIGERVELWRSIYKTTEAGFFCARFFKPVKLSTQQLPHGPSWAVIMSGWRIANIFGLREYK